MLFLLDSLIGGTGSGVDIASLIFVLSAVHPDKFADVLSNVACVLKPGGLLVFRDYGLYDMAQVRFGRGNKLGENFYVRQDGTRWVFLFSLYNGLGLMTCSIAGLSSSQLT